MGSGLADVFINDLLFTALLVLAACMVLGMLSPRWPWRWVLIVGLSFRLRNWCVRGPIREASRAQIYGSFLAFLQESQGPMVGRLCDGDRQLTRRKVILHSSINHN